MSSNHSQDLSQFLAKCVNDIKNSYPWLSIVSIAKKLEIPNSTFDRIAKAEVKAPSFNHALKVVQEARGKESVQGFVKKFYPNMLENFKRIYQGNNEVPFVDPSTEEFFQDSTSFEIMMMVSSQDGLSREKVVEEFGKRGLFILESLAQNGIVSEENEKFIIKGNINATQGTVQKLLKNLVEQSYDLDSFGGDKRNWLSVQYESVNKEYVLPRMREICSRAAGEIRALLKDSQSKGSDVVWAGLVADSLTKNSTYHTGVKDKGLVQ